MNSIQLIGGPMDGQHVMMPDSSTFVEVELGKEDGGTVVPLNMRALYRVDHDSTVPYRAVYAGTRRSHA